MLRISRSAGEALVFKLSGRMEAENISEVKAALSSESRSQRIVLNLEDLTLVDQDAVSFLESCEADRISLENCPAYIREWIDTKAGEAKGKKRRTAKTEAHAGPSIAIK